MGMQLETQVAMSQEIGVFLLDEVADVIDEIRKAGLNFDRNGLVAYLNNVNQVLKKRDLRFVSNFHKVNADDIEEMKAHYITSALTHILGWPILGVWIDEELTKTFEDIVTSRYKTESPLILRFREPAKKRFEENTSLIEPQFREINFSGTKTTMTKLKVELQRLSRILTKEENYSQERHLAFEGIYNFGLPLLGGYHERENFSRTDEKLKEEHGEFALKIPKYFR